MLDNVVFCKYYRASSDIHSLNSLAKIICLLLLIVSLILIDNLNIIAIIFVFELLIYLVSNIPIKIILKNILSIKYLIIFILLINTITGVHILVTLGLLLKIVGITFATSIFVLTTTTKKILDGLNQLLYPFSKLGIKTHVISLIISLAIRFIPITLEEANRIIKSLKARGLSDDSSISSKFVGLKSLITPLYLSTFRKADNLADMMELRLYNVCEKKKCRFESWNYLDIFLVVIHVIILLMVLKEVVL